MLTNGFLFAVLIAEFVVVDVVDAVTRLLIALTALIAGVVAFQNREQNRKLEAARVERAEREERERVEREVKAEEVKAELARRTEAIDAKLGVLETKQDVTLHQTNGINDRLTQRAAEAIAEAEQVTTLATAAAEKLKPFSPFDTTVAKIEDLAAKKAGESQAMPIVQLEVPPK